MDTYVFANQKGGVGKTTVTIGIAAELAARGRRVLLIDLDAQASATKVVGIDVDGASMADVMLEPDRYALPDAIATTGWGFDLAPSEIALASRESHRSTADEFVLRRQLRGCRGYDVVLVDCPPSLGVLTLNALAAATHLVVVTEPSFLALQGIEELLEIRDLVCAHYNPELALAGVVVNRVERTVEHRVGLAEIASFFGADLVWSPTVPKRTVLQDAVRRGRPLWDLRGRAADELCTEFRALAAPRRSAPRRDQALRIPQIATLQRGDAVSESESGDGRTRATASQGGRTTGRETRFPGAWGARSDERARARLHAGNAGRPRPGPRRCHGARRLKSDRVTIDVAWVRRIIRLLSCALALVAPGAPASEHAATCAD